MAQYPVPKTIKNVQYLRAAACCSVLLYHATGGNDGGYFVGQAGVDLFFLISGFIMWTVTEEKERDPATFMQHRLLRIVPLYWTVTFAVFAKRLTEETAVTTDLLYSMLFIPHSYSDGSTYPIVVPGWTLNYEMFFYVVFAAMLWLRRSSQFFGIAALFATLVLVGQLIQPTNIAASTYSDPIILEFVGGTAIAKARFAGRLPGPYLGAALLAMGVLTLGAEQYWAFGHRELRAALWGVPCAAVLVGAIALEERTPRLALLKFLGDASYAIYLVHDPVINVATRFKLPELLSIPANVLSGIAIGSALYLVEARVLRSTPTKPWRPAAEIPAP